MTAFDKASRGIAQRALDLLRALSVRVTKVLGWLVARRFVPDFNPRLVFGFIGIALLAVGAAITWLAQPSPLPLSGTFLDRMGRPFETASYTRLTFVSSGFNVVTMSDDGQTIWALGDNGLALRSQDGGRSWTLIPWRSQTSATSQEAEAVPNFNAICMLAQGAVQILADNVRSAWELDPSKTAMVQGGFRTWESNSFVPNSSCVTRPTNPADGIDARFATGGNGIGNEGPTLVHAGVRVLTFDNAAHGTTLYLPTATIRLGFPQPAPVVRGGFIDDKTSERWLVTADGRILHAPLKSQSWLTAAVARTWRQGKPKALNAITFTDDGVQGWAAGDGGEIFHSTDSGAHWSQMGGLDDRSALSAIVFAADGLTGWAAGAGGLYATTDGGTHWSPAVIVPASLNAWLGWPDTAYAIDASGTLQRCDARGQHCSPDSFANLVLPPPWALLTLLLALATLAFAGVAPRSIAETNDDAVEGSATAYAADKPLMPGQFDLLNLGSIAQGLADFLVNRRTEPPLSLAVDGPWGSGKSSLLNLFVAAEAPRRRFRLVWFNAWHHEKEENTLGAILEMICRDAIPRALSPLGFVMRWNLWRQRAAADPLRYLLIFSCVVFVLYAVWKDPWDTATWLQGWLIWLENLFGGGKGAGDVLLSRPKSGLDAGALHDLLPYISGAFLLTVTYFNFRTKLQAFTSSASGFLPRLVFTKDRRALMNDVGMRNRFAKEFAAVTKAMRPQRLVIVIDDLDRCQPEKVVEILQLINFLMTSGDCFIIAAGDLHWVEACIREQYGKVGQSLVDAEDNVRPGQNARSGDLFEFSHRYLRKIINVVIRVPRMSAAQSAIFVQSDAIGAERTLRKVHARRWYAYVGGALALLLAVAAPIELFQLLQPEILPQAAAPPTAAAVAPVQSDTQAAPPAQLQAASPPGQETASQDEVANGTDTAPAPVVRPGTPAAPTNAWWLAVPLAVLGFFLAIAWQVWRIAEATRKTDSKAFTDALEHWVPVIYAAMPTPRDIRRFMNQARYLTAQNRNLKAASLKDDDLVQLVALEFIDRDWFDGLDADALDHLRRELGLGNFGLLPEDWPLPLKKAMFEAFRRVAQSHPPEPGPADPGPDAAPHADPLEGYRALSASSDFKGST